jgi:outer membrane protein
LAHANDTSKYSSRVVYGSATTNSLGDVMIGNLGSHPRDLSVVAIDAGYLLKKDFFDLPIDIYAKGGLSYFNEDVNDNTYEILTYIKAFYNIDFLANRVRFGFGEGVSYTTSVLEAERYESLQDGYNTSNFLNYLDISLDFDIGKLIHYKPMHETYFGILLKHRSGIFGLINNVKHGGSNYNSIYLEKNF